MLVLAVLLLPLLSTASSDHNRRHDHSHNAAKRLPSTWYHGSDHPVHSLFKRGEATDGITYAAVASTEWQSAYPPGPPTKLDPQAIPQAWKSALDAAIARKAIPDIPVAKAMGDDNPAYPAGMDPLSPQICSATYKCRIKGDIWDVADGHLGISFDDGPTEATPALLAFLKQNNQPVTHFMIGSNLISNPQQFLAAFNQGNDIAVHTWTHPHMTTLSNLEVVAELGWTMEIIHNSTGGRIPKFWRPPYGDSDVRTTAIAREVFGLTTVIWNQDTLDWSLTTNGTTRQIVSASMTDWIGGPKSPGLNILEHETSDQSVQAFIAAYPMMKAKEWQVASLAQLIGDNKAYQNSASNTGDVKLAKVGAAVDGAAGGASSTPPPTKTASQKNAAAATSSRSASATPSSAASSRWATGSTGTLAAAVLFMFWA